MCWQGTGTVKTSTVGPTTMLAGLTVFDVETTNLMELVMINNSNNLFQDGKLVTGFALGKFQSCYETALQFFNYES